LPRPGAAGRGPGDVASVAGRPSQVQLTRRGNREAQDPGPGRSTRPPLAANGWSVALPGCRSPPPFCWTTARAFGGPDL